MPSKQSFLTIQIEISYCKIFTAHYTCRNADWNLTVVIGLSNELIFHVINLLIESWRGGPGLTVIFVVSLAYTSHFTILRMLSIIPCLLLFPTLVKVYTLSSTSTALMKSFILLPSSRLCSVLPPLAPIFCSWETWKSKFFHTNHMTGSVDFTDLERCTPFSFS